MMASGLLDSEPRCLQGERRVSCLLGESWYFLLTDWKLRALATILALPGRVRRVVPPGTFRHPLGVVSTVAELPMLSLLHVILWVTQEYNSVASSLVEENCGLPVAVAWQRRHIQSCGQLFAPFVVVSHFNSMEQPLIDCCGFITQQLRSTARGSLASQSQARAPDLFMLKEISH